MNGQLVVLFFAIILSSVLGQSNKPNFLHIFTDDQSYRTVGAYPESHSWVRTPNIDKLATDGVRFTHAYIGAKCVPSRASTLTGLLQFNMTEETGYWVSNFKDQGYFTGMIGKWHWRAGIRYDTTWNWGAIWEHHLNNSDYYVDQPVRINNGSNVTLSYSTDGYTDYAIEFINERANSNSPWYLWLCYAAVHGPYTPAPRHQGDYSGETVDIPVDIYSDGPGRSDKPAFFNNLSWWSPNPEGIPERKSRTIHSWSQQYNEGVLAIDEGVGRIRRTLDSSGLLDNTVIIFTSDQGYAWGQHGWMGKRYPHDAAIRGPLIIFQPNKINGNKVITNPVNGPDVIQTIHTLAGISPTGELFGRDLTGLITGNNNTLNNNVMMQVYTGNNYGNDQILNNLQNNNWTEFIYHDPTGSESWLMIIEDGYKYIRYLAPNTIEEVYNLNTDPEELINLAADPNFYQNLTSLRSSFEKELLRNDATFVNELPDPKMLYIPVPIKISWKKSEIPKIIISDNKISFQNELNNLMEINIYNLKGKEILYKKSNGRLKISLQNIISGSYIISVSVNGIQRVYENFEI